MWGKVLRGYDTQLWRWSKVTVGTRYFRDTRVIRHLLRKTARRVGSHRENIRDANSRPGSQVVCQMVLSLNTDARNRVKGFSLFFSDSFWCCFCFCRIIPCYSSNLYFCYGNVYSVPLYVKTIQLMCQCCKDSKLKNSLCLKRHFWLCNLEDWWCRFLVLCKLDWMNLVAREGHSLWSPRVQWCLKWKVSCLNTAGGTLGDDFGDIRR